jgi:hypothetical protein
LYITNVRVLWRKIGESDFILNENRLNIKSPVNILKTKDPNSEIYVMEIKFNGEIGDYYLRFTGEEGKSIADRVKQILD